MFGGEGGAMLELLDEVLAAVPALIDNPGEWGSLVINRRKPFTYRASTTWRGYRVCLHRFEACDEEEALLHPHPWPGAFAVVRGSYLMGVGFSADRLAKPSQVLRTVMGPGSRYEIVTPLTWHSVVPREECYTVMVNGEAWPADVAHAEVRTTKGKGLEPMTAADLAAMFAVYRAALGGSRLEQSHPSLASTDGGCPSPT
jgi:hypothetical protein